jgi:hypothetical protein
VLAVLAFDFQTGTSGSEVEASPARRYVSADLSVAREVKACAVVPVVPKKPACAPSQAVSQATPRRTDNLLGITGTLVVLALVALEVYFALRYLL